MGEITLAKQIHRRNESQEFLFILFSFDHNLLHSIRDNFGKHSENVGNA